MATKKQAAASENQEAQQKTEKAHYQEWMVKISTVKKGGENVREYEKLKIIRPAVKISEDSANILNEGVLYGNNNIAKMYFLPE